MLTYRQSISPGEQLDDPSSSPHRTGNPGAGRSGAARYTMENFDLAGKKLRILDEERQLALEGRDYRPSSNSQEEEYKEDAVEQGRENNRESRNNDRADDVATAADRNVTRRRREEASQNRDVGGDIDFAQAPQADNCQGQEGYQPLMIQMVRIMMDQNLIQHHAQQQMQKEMIDHNREVSR